MVEELQCCAVGEVAEMVQVTGRNANRAVPEPRLHRGERHALQDPLARRGMTKVVQSSAPSQMLPVCGAHEHDAVELTTAGPGEEPIVGVFTGGEPAYRGEQRVR